MSGKQSNGSEWIGIDLGTTNTVAAVYKNGGPMLGPGYVEVIYVVESSGTLTDSTVYYDRESDVVLIGKQAVNEKATNPENTICDAKRIMGLACSDDSVLEFQRKLKQFKIVNSCGYAAFEIVHNGRTIRQTPVDVAAKILSKIRETADEWANGAIIFKKAVITVPANFGQEQLAGTFRAAKEAGFEEVHLVKEPNAAAIFYGFKHQRFDGYTILVVDYGGGTLDVSILKVQNGNFEVVALRGRKWLGGRDLDELIRNEMVKRIKDQFGYDCTHCRECVNCIPAECPRAKRDMQVLLERCERLKIFLSTVRKSSLALDFIGIRGQVHLTREEYEELVKPQLSEVIETVKEAVDGAKMKAEEIQEVQMTGGSSSTPILGDMLEAIGFQRDRIKRLEPMHAVAKGAAIIGAQLDEQTNTQLPCINLIEICPLSIGTNLVGDLFSPIIHRGTKIPCSFDQKFNTCKNDQRNMAFDIYEGERKLAKENNLIGHFSIYDLSEGVAGSVLVKLNLTIDRDGILHARATHKDSFGMLDANYKEKRADTAKVGQMIVDAEKHLLADSKEEKRIKKKNELLLAIEHAKYKCSNARIIALCVEFENWLKKYDHAKIDRLESAFNRFNAKLAEIPNPRSIKRPRGTKRKTE